MADRALADDLIEALAGPFGPVTIEELTRLTGGASRETWSFDALDSAGTRHECILQRNRGRVTLGLGFDVEDRLLARAWDAGVPIPEIIADAQQCAALGDGRITRRVAGEALGPRIVRSDRFAAVRPRLVGQMAQALAAIHSIDPDEVSGLAEADPVELLRAGFDALGVVSPAFELALRWLDEHRPTDTVRSVVHGDFRIGNLIVNEHTGLAAVLDWELAHLGDPVEDLGWLCVRAWRFGSEGVVGGVGDLADLLAAYRDASGFAVTEADVRWWMVAGTLRWGLICAVQANRHLRGDVVSVELATIGRRIAENEHDVLDLLDVPPHPSPDDLPTLDHDPRPDDLPTVDDDPGYDDLPTVDHDPRRDDLPTVDHDPRRDDLPTVDHGRPDAAALVAAVRRHLTDNVIDDLSGGTAYSTKVAANALGIVERELAAKPRPIPDIDEPALAARIRAGEAISEADRGLIRAAVTARIVVAHPGWADNPT